MHDTCGGGRAANGAGPARIVMVTTTGSAVGYGHVVRLRAVYDELRMAATVYCDGDAARFFPSDVTHPLAELNGAFVAGERVILIPDARECEEGQRA